MVAGSQLSQEIERDPHSREAAHRLELTVDPTCQSVRSMVRILVLCMRKVPSTPVTTIIKAPEGRGHGGQVSFLRVSLRHGPILKRPEPQEQR